MSSMYAMRRANGDWFAMEKNGHLHVPVFRSRRAALCAHWRNAGMMLFRPAVLDERALKELAPADEACAVSFWLVDSGGSGRPTGHLLEHAQLALLVHDPIE